MDEIFAKKSAGCGFGWMVDCANRLLYSADSMVCLFDDYTQTAGRNALLLG